MLILLIVTLAIVIHDRTAVDSPDTTLLMHTNDLVSFTNALGGAVCGKQVRNINYR